MENFNTTIKIEHQCPKCLKEMEALTNCSKEPVNAPHNGDFSICLYCGTILRFRNDVFIIALPDDLVELFEYSDQDYFLLLKIQKNIHSGYIKNLILN